MSVFLFLLGVLPVWQAHAAPPKPAFDKKYEAYTKLRGPGFAAMVLKNGELVYEKSFGFEKLGRGKIPRITASTSFNLASMSKQFTAFAVLLLEQRGALSAGDTLSKFFPNAPAFLRDVKVSQLLHHTAGLPEYTSICDKAGGNVHNSDVLDWLFKQEKLDFPAGDKYDYSNTGYVVLAEIVQLAAKKPFAAFLREEIFSKLSMKNTLVYSEETEARIANRSFGYSDWPYLEEDDASACNYTSGDGAVYTNLRDYHKWAAYLSGDGAPLLSPASRTKLWEPGLTNSGDSTGYAYGWSISEGRKFISHYGAWVGFHSAGGFFPEQKVWVVVFSNYRGLDIDGTAYDIVKQFLAPAKK